VTTRLLFIDADAHLAAHLAQAIASHNVTAVRDGFSVPRELLQLEAAARNKVRSGQSGSTFATEEATADAEVMAPRLLTYAEAGRLMAVSDSTVKRLVAAGDLSPVHIGGAARLRICDLDSYIDALVGGPADRPNLEESSPR
jgi:excisionase family DNA binding protein